MICGFFSIIILSEVECIGYSVSKNYSSYSSYSRVVLSRVE
jgi:hypothetical protein